MLSSLRCLYEDNILITTELEPDYSFTGTFHFVHGDYNPIRNYMGSWRDGSFNSFIDTISKYEELNKIIEHCSNQKTEVITAFFQTYFNIGLRNDIVISNLTTSDDNLEYEVYPLINSMEYKKYVIDGSIVKFHIKLWIGKKGSKQLQIKRLIFGKYLNPKNNKGAYHGMVPSIDLVNYMNPWVEGINHADYSSIYSIPRRRRELIVRSESWNSYLNYMIKDVENDQYCVKISNVKEVNLSKGIIKLYVFVPRNYTKTLKNQSYISIFPEKDSKDKYLWDIDELSNIDPTIPNLGKCDKVNEVHEKRIQSNCPSNMIIKAITIELDNIFIEKFKSNEERAMNYFMDKLENQFLSNAIIMDLAVYKVQQGGIRRLLLSESENPYLGDFIFDYREINKSSTFKDYVFKEQPLINVNKEQKISLQKILSNQHITLIQGPPGTGKTTIIAELAHQAAKEGKRVLIASQTNLAVDNAITRLEQEKEILPIRLGSSVTEDGLPFVEKNVVNTWFISVEKSIENKVKHENRVKIINERIGKLKDIISEYKNEQPSLNKKLSECRNKEKLWKDNLNRCNKLLDECDDEINKCNTEITKLNLYNSKDLALSNFTFEEYNDIKSSILTIDEWIFNLSKKLLNEKNLLVTTQKLPVLLEELSKLSNFEILLDKKKYDEYQSLLEKRVFMIEDDIDSEQLKIIGNSIKEIEKSVSSTLWIEKLDELNKLINSSTNIKEEIFHNVKNIDKLLGSLRPSENYNNIIKQFQFYIQQLFLTIENIEDLLMQNKNENEEKLIAEIAKYEIIRANKIQETKGLIRTKTELEKNLRELSNTNISITEKLSGREQNINTQKREILNLINAVDESISDYDELIRIWYEDNQHILNNDHIKWINLRNKWLEKIQNRELQDLNDIKDTYVQIANVVGATCYYTGKKTFYEKYGKFDYVVIDEVSKATPPEL
ncbi:MAG: AAA domain-containing protein, partial [Candidatus Heimdallarchaeota archaeon]|nr:AAA domain-containing protein [Candidatus Heimdallarchaeota archaeon]